MTRLTAQERALRAVKESELQRQVTDLATLLGWEWCHWRALRNGRGIWQVPVEGPLGKGWPDLTLIRTRDRRLIFAELKRETEQPTAAQAAVLAALRELMAPYPEIPADMPMVPARSYLGGVMDGMDKAFREAGRIEVHVWRPSDLRDPIDTSRVYEVLR